MWYSGCYEIDFNIFSRSEFLNILKMININSNPQSKLLTEAIAV